MLFATWIPELFLESERIYDFGSFTWFEGLRINAYFKLYLLGSSPAFGLMIEEI